MIQSDEIPGIAVLGIDLESLPGLSNRVWILHLIQEHEGRGFPELYLDLIPLRVRIPPLVLATQELAS